MAIWLVTGSNRGIGLEMTRRLLERGETVFAAARETERARSLTELRKDYEDKITILKLDVDDRQTISVARKKIEEHAGRLDVLVNNAGVYHEGDEADKLGHLQAEPILNAVRTNALGALFTAQEMVPLLEKSENPKVVNISSQMGSLEITKSGGNYAYNISKAAMNMALRIFAWDVQDKGIASILVHPGWVRTDMGGPKAHLSTEESAEGILRVIEQMTLDNTGQFYDWTGTEMPW